MATGTLIRHHPRGHRRRAGLAFTGTGSADDEAGTFEMDVTRGGDRLHYERDAEGGIAVTGTYAGASVDLER